MNIPQELSTIDFTVIGTRSLLVLPVTIITNAAWAFGIGNFLVPMLVLAKNFKKGRDRGQSNVDHARLLSKPKVEERNDSISRYFAEQGNISHIDTLINEFLKKNKPFLQHKYSLRQLAEDVDMPLHYLSAFINRYYKMNYNDFINRWRVRVGEEMIRKGECRYKTLEAVASECGFNNRNTFSMAFKKETGKSPSAFLKEITDQGYGALLLTKFQKSGYTEGSGIQQNHPDVKRLDYS